MHGSFQDLYHEIHTLARILVRMHVQQDMSLRRSRRAISMMMSSLRPRYRSFQAHLSLLALFVSTAPNTHYTFLVTLYLECLSAIMMDASTSTLFEDIFEVTALNPDGKKVFESVNRLAATGTTFECDLLLDINSEIYNVVEMDKLTLVLASTLNLDGSPADHFSYQRGEEPTLADNYEYVMHGRVFDVAHQKDGVVVIAASFGGLLMRLTGEQRHLTSLNPDMRLYLLLKKD